MTMKKTFAVIMALLVVCLPLFALADSTMRVVGSASVTVTPDIAVLTVGHSWESADSGLAQRETAAVIAAVVEALKAQGIDEDDIVTARLSTYPVYNYVNDTRLLQGYRVEHMLSITVRDLDKTGDILDMALAAGANQADSITYKTSREKEVYMQALALAVENAAAKADALAIATGMWLGTLDEVNEVAGQPYVYANTARYASADSATMGSMVMAGDLEISASVELVYEMR